MDETTGILRGVELFAPGHHNGEDYSVDDIDEMVRNSALCGFRPPVKLGHAERQALVQADGHPSAGWVENLRRVGSKLVGDITGIPKGIYDLVRKGVYDRLSPELYIDYTKGKNKLGKVLKAVALLGTDIPAITDLASLRAYLSESAAGSVRPVVVRFSYRTFQAPAEEPEPAPTGRGIVSPHLDALVDKLLAARAAGAVGAAAVIAERIVNLLRALHAAPIPSCPLAPRRPPTDQEVTTLVQQMRSHLNFDEDGGLSAKDSAAALLFAYDLAAGLSVDAGTRRTTHGRVVRTMASASLDDIWTALQALSMAADLTRPGLDALAAAVRSSGDVNLADVWSQFIVAVLGHDAQTGELLLGKVQQRIAQRERRTAGLTAGERSDKVLTARVAELRRGDPRLTYAEARDRVFAADPALKHACRADNGGVAFMPEAGTAAHREAAQRAFSQRTAESGGLIGREVSAEVLERAKRLTAEERPALPAIHDERPVFWYMTGITSPAQHMTSIAPSDEPLVKAGRRVLAEDHVLAAGYNGQPIVVREPQTPSGRVAVRVQQYKVEHPTADDSTALHEVLRADPDLKRAYRRSA